MASSRSQSLSGSTPRSHSSVAETQIQLEARLRSSLVYNPSSASSTATTLPGTSSIPGSVSKSRSKSSADTYERLRLAELELEKLRRAVDGEKERASEMRRLAEQERIIAERLKHEGSASGISSSEARLRVSQIKRDVHAAGAASSRRSTTGMFKTACSTDLLFLIDTTSSMGSYISSAKEQVKSIVNDIKLAFLNEAEIRVAVVGYKDHGDTGNPQFLDFTPSTDQVLRFLNRLHATGGADVPEDVLGGLKKALNASWSQQTRCIIHIADAPPHGRALQNSPPCADDRWSRPGSEPHGITHEPLLQQMISLKNNYAFLRINGHTDNMAFTFLKAYAEVSADCKLHTANRYHSQANAIAAAACIRARGSASSKSKSESGLVFEETQLGTTFSALRHLVVKMVTSSASRTAVRLSAPNIDRKYRSKSLGTNLGNIGEDEDGDEEVALETTPPQWESLSWFNEILTVEGFSPDVQMHIGSTLNDMVAHDDAIMMSVTELTIRKRSKPFAQGAMRVASYARTSKSTTRYVVKSYKKDEKRLAEDMRIQALCKAFALEFNALAGEEHSLDFIATTCLEVKSGNAKRDVHMSLEPFIGASYVKYNNNKNYVNDEIPNDRFNQAAQAFSHFTFERSQGRFLVCDLQGVGNLLTDPAIHTADPDRFKLSDPNLGKEGFKFFFQSHVCNAICTSLELKSNKSMVVAENYHFRERWPSMDNTACCSNKLCGKIVHLATANKSKKYPGYYWCNICWPQLQSTTKLMCVASGPDHEFELSKFFYETQGRSTPRKCTEHREENIEISRAGGSLSSHIGFEHRRDEVAAVPVAVPTVKPPGRGLILGMHEGDVGPELLDSLRNSRFSAPTREAPKRLTLGHLNERETSPPRPQIGRNLSTRLSLGHLEDLEDRATAIGYASPYKREPHQVRKPYRSHIFRPRGPRDSVPEDLSSSSWAASASPARDDYPVFQPIDLPSLPAPELSPATVLRSATVSRAVIAANAALPSRTATTSRAAIASRNASAVSSAAVSRSAAELVSRTEIPPGNFWSKIKSSIKRRSTFRNRR